MGQAYTPGLKVTTDTLLKQRRVLPLRGEVMVQANTTVGAQDVVARAELPGDIMPINMIAAANTSKEKLFIIWNGIRTRPKQQ